MENDDNLRDSSEETQGQPRFIASEWEREIALQFIEWRDSSGQKVERLRTFGEAINQTVSKYDSQNEQSACFASKLPAVLRSCDLLKFDSIEETLAYSALHLLDRYGRVGQVLEYLLNIGRLPLRKSGVRALEVGAGPAPALYAVRDFYAALKKWPGIVGVEVGPVISFDTLDSGVAWDHFLHRLSETLMTVRGGLIEEGQLAFCRTVHDFTKFNVAERHHRMVAAKAESIRKDFDAADEHISNATAWQMAYEEGVGVPSAYDLVFLCNFLTQAGMTDLFERELLGLMNALTPGGLLIVLGGTGGEYPKTYSRLRILAGAARLRDLSPQNSFHANSDATTLDEVANHVRQNVICALSQCPIGTKSKIEKELPEDLLLENTEFRLPKFQALIFVREGPPRKGRRKKRTRS